MNERTKTLLNTCKKYNNVFSIKIMYHTVLYICVYVCACVYMYSVGLEKSQNTDWNNKTIWDGNDSKTILAY